MKQLLRCLCACAALSTAFAQGATVSMQQVPAAAKKTIEAQVAGAKVDQIEREDADGEVTYTVSLSRAGRERSLTVGEDGTLLSLEVGLEETPPAVQKTVKAQLGAGTLDSVEKTFDNGEISFEVEMTAKNGTERSFTVAADGRLTCVQVSLEEAPAPVRKTIEANLGSGKLQDLFRLIEHDELSYDAEVSQGGKLRDVIVAPDGRLESLQVFLGEIPTEAQKTIQEKIGTGRIVRIDKVFEQRRGVTPYEIEGRKDGKPFNFSVGPRGRFLGMED